MKIASMILLVIALGLIAYWAFNGASLFTLEQVPFKQVDPLFGTEQTIWKDEFRPGLLPVIGPVAAGLLLLAGGLYLWPRYRGRRQVPA